MNSVTRFFHELFNPHCEHCMESLRESKVCDTCEYLKLENARLHQENQLLLEKLINKPTKIETKSVEQTELRPINPGLTKSWAVKRQLLESESRASALELAKKKEESKLNKSVEELENELLGKTNASKG